MKKDYSVVNEVKKWKELILHVLGRQQTPTAATGCCGYNGVKRSLGIHDMRHVMIDTKRQIEDDMSINIRAGVDNLVEIRDLQRVESFLKQVENSNIDRSGWFSDFLAEYVCKVYGVSILIIRENGNFTFIQVKIYSFMS